MKITHVKVSAGRSTKYGAYKFHVELEADISEGEDYNLVLQDLQERIATVCADHMQAVREVESWEESGQSDIRVPFGIRVGNALDAIHAARKEGAPSNIVQQDFTRKKRRHGI